MGCRRTPRVSPTRHWLTPCSVSTKSTKTRSMHASPSTTRKAGGETTVSFPERYETGGAHFAPDGHIYVDDDGQYPVSSKLNPWEVSTIEALKTKFPGFLGWWRNGTGGDQSLGVRYTDSASTARTMYPDFL